MKIAAIVCNIVMLGFVLMVNLTDGPPAKAADMVFGLLLVLIPILNIVVISRSGTSRGRREDTPKGPASAAPREILAIIDQYPHPQESGLLEFELLVLLAPVLSAAIIVLSRKKRRMGQAERVQARAGPDH